MIYYDIQLMASQRIKKQKDPNLIIVEIKSYAIKY